MEEDDEEEDTEEEDKEEEDKEAEVTVEVVHKRDAASQLRESLQYLTVLLTQELFQFCYYAYRLRSNGLTIIRVCY